MMRKTSLLTMLAAALGVATTASGQNPTPSISFNVPGPADWNTAASWTSDAGPFVPGDGFADEVAEIANGGTAFLSAPAQFVIDGLVVGPGQLQIRNGGSLTVTPSPSSTFFGFGRTFVTGGSLSIEGTGKLTTSELHLANSALAATFSPATTTPIVATGATTLGGTLSVGFSGVTPAVGQSYRVIDAAPGELSGTFASITTADLPRGLAAEPVYNTADGDVSVSIDNRLVLSVDRRTGATAFSNVTGPAITLDGYTIASPSGQLSATEWQSLDDKNAPVGWFEANPSANRVSELNPTASLAVASGQSFAIGAPYNWTPAEFGEPSVEDLSFSYFTPDGDTEQGIVEYSGLHNNLVLLVDPATGEAALQNQSTFNVAIDFYTITSASGSLDPTGWESLDDQNVGVWAEANPSDTRLSELYPVGGSAFTPGKGYEIGNAFTVGGTRDLELRFTLADGTSYDGIVEYGEFTIGTGPVGDTNGDGQVNLDDLNNVRNNFGGAGLGDTDGDNDVDLDDLNNVRNNFGATSSAAVPEPATWLLALLGVPFAARRLRRR